MKVIMKKKLTVIVPIYKKQLNRNETISVELCAKKMKQYDLFFIMPEHLDATWYRQFQAFEVKRFPDKYFKGTDTYNKLMLNPKFYKKFSEYEYMLIAQTDTLILGLPEEFGQFLDGDIDYIGAPWEKEQKFYFYTTKRFLYQSLHWGHEVLARVGNGGFSLRKIDKTIELLKEKRFWRLLWRGNEDFFFACYGEHNRCGFRLASIQMAEKFALETNMKLELKLRKRKPFAVHKWEAEFDFYEEIQEYIR